MIPEPDKTPHRSVSLLSAISKVFKKPRVFTLKRVKQLREEKMLIPYHQPESRNKHSMIDQVHKVINILEKALEAKHICATLLDVAQGCLIQFGTAD